MTEMRRLLQAGALVAERCDNIQYFEDRYGVSAGSIANVSLIDSPFGPAMYWSGDCTFRILDHRFPSQIRDATNWTWIVWDMWDGTTGSNFGSFNIGGNTGVRINVTPTPSLNSRFRTSWATDGNVIASPFSARVPGEWKMNAGIARTDNSVNYYYQSGNAINSQARTLNDTIDPTVWSYDGCEIGEEWSGSPWSGGIYAVAVFPFSLTEDELNDIYGGNF
jgi:hypothetical protein